MITGIPLFVSGRNRGGTPHTGVRRPAATAGQKRMEAQARRNRGQRGAVAYEQGEKQGDIKGEAGRFRTKRGRFWCFSGRKGCENPKELRLFVA